MRITLTVLLVSSLAVSACGFRDSRINPRNWFGGSRPAPVSAETGETNTLIPATRGGMFQRPPAVDRSVLLDTVTELRVEPTTSGAIVYASGVASRQGAFGVALVPADDELLPDESGVLAFAFRATYPNRATPTGSEFSRTVHAAFTISKRDLQRIGTIRVVAAGNARETSRR